MNPPLPPWHPCFSRRYQRPTFVVQWLKGEPLTRETASKTDEKTILCCLQDHFRSLFIKCKVEKEKTKLAEKRAKERRKRKEAGLEEATSSESERDDDGAELGDR